MYHLGKYLLCLVLGGGVFSACSDKWDEHYQSVQLGEGTLWQIMSQNPDLSNFMEVLDSCGYKSSLNGSQVFSVFAPVNSVLTPALRDSVIALYQAQKSEGVKEIRNAAVKEFVMNHVALYSHSVSSLTNDSIVMMNGKYVLLTNKGFESGNFLSQNVLTKNGILFTVDKLATYEPNIYEYLQRDGDLDSVRNYIYSYSLDVFNPAQSVPGEIKDGKTQYLDSVTYFDNKLLDYFLEAELNDEDSTYWLLAPTNQVWDSLLTEYTNYYQYDEKVIGRDSMMFNFPRLGILRGTTFSLNVNKEQAIKDSIFSTLAYPFSYRKYAWGSSDLKYYQFDRPYDAGGIFEQTTDIACSNGVVKKTDLWNVDKTNTFMKKIVMEGASNATFDSVYSVNTRDPRGYYVESTNPFYDKVYNNTYLEIAPTSTSNIQALFDIRNVLSNVPYDVYLVALPLTVQDTLANPVPTDFRATLFYHDNSGKEVNFPVTGKFTTKAAEIDTVFIGTYTFPTCSYGVDKPQVKMLVEGRTSATSVRQGKATKTLLLDCIIFKPRFE